MKSNLKITSILLGIAIAACLAHILGTTEAQGPSWGPYGGSLAGKTVTNVNILSATNVTIYDSLTVNTNVTINQNLTVKGNSTFNQVTITGLSNNNWTASTLLEANASHNAVSLANGTGFLHNDGSGVFAWSTDGSSLSGITAVTMVRSIDIPMGAWFTNNIGDGASLTAASSTSITNAGDGWIFASGSNTNCIRTVFGLPWDWNGGTVKVGTFWLCSGTNSVVATNIVANIKATAIGAGDDVSNPTFGNVRLTNNINIAAWERGTEGITGLLTIGNTPGVTKQILWEIQRQSKDGGDSETNTSLILAGVRIYYTAVTTATLPTSSP